jgi:hypothetical protein
MSERFPRQFDHNQHQRLRKLYGERVPPIENILVRRGHHDLIDRMFAELGRLPQDRNRLRVVRIEIKAAGWLKISATGTSAKAEEVLLDVYEAARTICEHCGDAARLVIKVGLEALIHRPDLDPVDRLLCLDCAHVFQENTAGGIAGDMAGGKAGDRT